MIDDRAAIGWRVRNAAWRGVLLLAFVVATLGPARAEIAVTQPPLVEADKAPTRVRPPNAEAGGAAAAVKLELPVLGVPAEPAVTPPADARVVTTKVVGTTASAKRFRLQLASLASATAARAEQHRLQRRLGQQATALRLVVERVRGAHRAAAYRVISRTVGDSGKAMESCAALTARGMPCLVVAAHGPAPGSRGGAEASAPTRVISAAASPSHASAAARPVLAQLATLHSLGQATRELHRLTHRYAGVLQHTRLVVSRIDQGERGVFYRVVTMPLANRTAAGSFCQRLGSPSGCLLIADRPRLI